MKIFEKFDKTLLIILVLLIGIGVLMVLSASPILAYKRFDAPYNFFIKQLIWVAIGVVFLFFTSQINGGIVRRFARIAFWIWTALLLMLLIFGEEINGAKRWLDIGFISLQPAEFMKVLLIIFLADYIDRKKSKLTSFRHFLKLLLILALPLTFIALQPDLGTVIIMMLITFSMLSLGGAKANHLAFLLALCMLVVTLEIARHPYRRVRIVQYIEQFSGKEMTMQTNMKRSTQQENAIKALTNGGWFGVGPGNSTLKLFFLPEPHTDFIFSIIGEEFGFIGALFVASLFFMLFFRSYQIAKISRDLYSYLLVMGIALFLSSQAIFHIGVSCGILPTKGLTLPFISFGGSSLISSMIAAGFLLKHSVRLSANNR